MSHASRLLQRMSHADWRTWLARLEHLPSWKLFLGALLLGLMLSLPWQCARLLGEKKPPEIAAAIETAPDAVAQAPDRRNTGRAQSILGMPAPGIAPPPELPAPVDPSSEPTTADPASDTTAMPEPSTQPNASAAVVLHAPAPQYPAAALRGREEGTVMVRVDIDASGLPLRVGIEKSSRSRALDRAAVDAVGQWRFKPAIVQGAAVESSLIVPISFKSDDGGQ